MANNILEYFDYEHLRTSFMRVTSQHFHDLAFYLDATLPNGAEKSVALRKLLEAKDAAVRSAKAIDPPLSAKERRENLVAVLLAHQRKDSSSCTCGSALPLGSSFFNHVIDYIEKDGRL